MCFNSIDDYRLTRACVTTCVCVCVFVYVCFKRCCQPNGGSDCLARVYQWQIGFYSQFQSWCAIRAVCVCGWNTPAGFVCVCNEIILFCLFPMSNLEWNQQREALSWFSRRMPTLRCHCYTRFSNLACAALVGDCQKFPFFPVFVESRVWRGEMGRILYTKQAKHFSLFLFSCVFHKASAEWWGRG